MRKETKVQKLMEENVLYDDGDMEVLCLDKEHRELIDNGHKPTKKSKPSKGSAHKEFSQQNKKSIDINSPSKIRGKRTPRKNLKHVQKGAPKSKTTSELLEADSRGSPGISDPEHAEMHKHDDMNSGFIRMGTNENEISLLILLFLRNTVDLCTRQRLMQFASTKMCERIDIPQISLGILNGMVKSDFPNEKSHAQWKKRQLLLFGIDTPRNWEIISTTLLVADAVWPMVSVQARPMIEPHPKVQVAGNSSPNGSTGVSWPLIPSWIVNILEELLCSANNRTIKRQTIGSLLTKGEPKPSRDMLNQIREIIKIFAFDKCLRWGCELVFLLFGYFNLGRKSLIWDGLFGFFDFLYEANILFFLISECPGYLSRTSANLKALKLTTEQTSS
ncbi:hypothetical protein LOK49_LG06G01373, partial [Camellia lanceoleosa]